MGRDLQTRQHLLERGEQNSVADLFPALFEALPVLIYNGIYDMDCNFIGTDGWIEGLSWSFRDEFLNAPRVPWLVDGALACGVRSARSLAEMLVTGAGHAGPDGPARGGIGATAGLHYRPLRADGARQPRDGGSRSEFFARAARRYLDKLASSSLTEQVNDALQAAGSDDRAAVAVESGHKRLAAGDGR